MSQPRPVYPGATNFSTRCVERELHELITRQVNRLYGEWGGMWERDPSGRAECQDALTVLSKIVYTMTNPVKDGLVAHGKSWPGVRRCWPAKDKVIERPKGFFRDQGNSGTWPETATLRFTRPPGFDHLSDETLGQIIRDAIEAEESRCRDQSHGKNRRFLGRRKCLEMSRYAYPVSDREHFGINPQVAGQTEPRIEALEERELFREEHDQARRAFFAGHRDVLFPYGTWKMRRYYGARCRPPPA